MTLTPADVVELATITRSGFVESRHLGAAVVLDPDGAVVRALGNVGAPVFPRSALKPIQAAVSVSLAPSNADIADDAESLGLATASHTGTPEHVAVVERMLATAGLGVESLRCPPALPTDAEARYAVRAAGGGPERPTMNCSGKHAAMLAACVAQGWPTESYLDPDHPLQIEVRAVLEAASGEAVAAVGVDGCGAPVFAVSLLGLARAMQWFASDAVGHAVRDAVLANPWTIQGPGRENTAVVEELGVFAKGGAEGVLALVTPSGWAVALKVLDGSARATTLVGLELLVGAGALERADADRALARLELDVPGGGAPVGRISASV